MKIKSFIKSIKGNTFLKNVLLVLSGTVLAQSLGIITTPIITRLYNPEHFGILSLFMAIAGVLTSFSSLRYEVAIPIERNLKKAHSLVKLSLLILFGIFLFFNVAYLFLEKLLLKHFTSLQQIENFIWLIPWLFLFTGIFRIFSAWSLREKAFKLIAKIKIIQSLLSSLTKITLGYFGFGIVGLLAGNFLFESIGFSGHFRKLKESGFSFFSNTTWLEIKSVANRYKKFPLYQTWSQLFLSISQRLPIFFITSLYGFKTVGLYGFSNTIISMPINVIGNSVAQVYFSEISEMGKSNSLKLFTLSKDMTKKMFLLSLLPLIVILFFGPQLFAFAFGENWEMAGEFSQYLIVLITLKFITTPIMSCLNVLEKQEIQFKLNAIRTFLLVVVFFTCNFYEFDVFNTIMIYSIVLSVFYFLVLTYIFILLKINITKK